MTFVDCQPAPVGRSAAFALLRSTAVGTREARGVGASLRRGESDRLGWIRGWTEVVRYYHEV